MALKVSWGNIVKLLQEGEGPTVEFIPQIKNSKDITKVIIGFANAQGGTVVLGLDDKNGHLNGVDITPEWVSTVCKTECEPPISPQVGELLRHDKRLLVLQVKEGSNKPYRTVDGSVLTREGSETREASVEEQKELNPWGVGGINPRQKKALSFITDHGSISNMQYREICDVSHKTAHIELIDLVEKGVLRVEGQGRSTAYVLVQKDNTLTKPAETGVQNDLPSSGQLFAFEEIAEAEKGTLVPKPAEVKPPKTRAYIRKPAARKPAETQKNATISAKKADNPVRKGEEEETFEPPIKTKEDVFDDAEDIEPEKEPPVIAGEDYADIRPTAKAPEVDDEEEKDASSPSFLDL